MARPREFDTDKALEMAMQVFWSKGYEAASLEALCEATGLGRSSLYAAFTDKRHLYMEVLDHYHNHTVERVARALGGPADLRGQLQGFLHDTIDSIVSGKGRRGCMIGNSAAELPQDDPEVAAIIRQGIERQEAAFRGVFEHAKQRGELKPGANVEAIARFLTASFHGLRLIGKARRERAALEDVAAHIVKSIDFR